MRATCPECGTQAHVTAFFVEEDGKRLAMTVAAMPPDLGRATLAYLGLFKPAKTSLRIGRAAKIAAEVAELVAPARSVRTSVRACVARQAPACGQQRWSKWSPSALRCRCRWNRTATCVRWSSGWPIKPMPRASVSVRLMRA